MSDADVEPLPSNTALSLCDIALEYSDRVNFAMQQNGVPLVGGVRLSSRATEAIDDISIELSIANGDALSWSGSVARLSPGAGALLHPLDFRLSPQSLATRTELERTELVCRLSYKSEQRSEAFPIEILTYDEWPGLGHYPELTAAFVTPNHPTVAELLGVARHAMRDLCDSDALDGYQSGSRTRAAHLAEACFNAAASRDIGYSNPPASFESTGQRVRLVDRLIRERLGTCLDLSLLLASLWEQCGLHPLVLLLEGHAMPAVWTHAAHLPEAVIDEPATIRNLIELGEIVPVEATHLTAPGARFGSAVDAAKTRMRGAGATFVALDIRSSRKRGVRPLPLRADGETGVDPKALQIEIQPTAAGTALDRVALAERAELESGGRASAMESASQRIERWKTRLLDLSLRTRLLNFRSTGRALNLNVPDLARVEDRLADGDSFSILHKSDTTDSFLRDELDAGRLHSGESSAETAKRLLNLYRIAKASIEETGANVLYLALGFLRWFELESSDQERMAPLILLPVHLVRASAGAGYHYSVRLSDEPLRPNVTLLEKLRVDFGIATEGLDQLPEDEHGIDVELVLRKIRDSIRNSPRWEVVESAALGLFSFNKFLMWKDLQENHARLKENRLVGHLVDRPGQDFDPLPFPSPEAIDTLANEDVLLCTRDADSSQQVAIRAAADRRTFVLEGPPGTGKSQTIANVIADSLGRGRRVLFVAEKMAALTVVRRRLEQDGLGPFCLELHSAKASKKEVLAQLEDSLRSARVGPPEDDGRMRAELETSRGHLNTYVRELHASRATGESLYRMMGRLSLIGDGPSVAPPLESPDTATREDLDRWRRLLDECQRRARPVDPPDAFPLRGIRQSQWSFNLPQSAQTALAECQHAVDALSRTASAFLGDLDLATPIELAGRNGIHALSVAASLLQKNTSSHEELVHGPDAGPLRQRVHAYVAAGRERDALRSQVLQRYREEILDLDPLDYLEQLNRHLKQARLVRLFTARPIKKSLRKFALSELPPLPEVAADLERLREARRLDARLRSDSEVAGALRRRFDHHPVNWTEIEEMCRWCESMSKALAAISADDALSGSAARLGAVAADPERAGRASAAGQRLVQAWLDLGRKRELVERILSNDPAHGLSDGPRSWLPSLAATLQRWTGNLSALNSWCTWRAARDAACEGGLTPVIELYEKGGCRLDAMEAIFWRSFGRPWFNAVADGVDAIRSFNTDAHLDTISKFASLDLLSLRVAQKVVPGRLASTIPSISGNPSTQSEMGILRREMAKKRRHLPTRRLIESMPTLLPRLKPCFLMSPLSVAQFLDANLPPFDLVVFDEASQIPVWDAIGAIARGAEVVVVGDSKQLPPTAFFSTLDSDDELEAEEHAVDDMESILKECNASGIPSLRLRWHYRSRHETLIAFSNHHYYDNELHTFPSPEERSDDLGVTLHHVPDGVYDRGGSRTNRIEATRVVDRVVGMLLEPDFEESIGIVTFSQAQQTLVEDLLDQRRRESPQIERHFTSAVAEPVIVKNLENVQGDERDCIIFSVGYGRDQAGKPSMNFGPLNKEGGERRLNVAVTRARRRLLVFSSITSDDIDLRRTRALGVAHLKTFLDYAKRGPIALAAATTLAELHDFDSDFERAVHSSLVGLGWEVDTQVGCAGYRIDLAIRHPEMPGRYLVGIECDGATYHSAKTARDRDRLRQSVLEGLGWRILRVWSTDWVVNRAGCLEKLRVQIESELAAPPRTPESPQQSVVSPIEEPPAPPLAAEADPEPPEALPRYMPARVTGSRLASINVYDASATGRLVQALAEIVSIESPMTRSLAMKRLAGAIGIQRVREQFRERFDQVVSAASAARSIQAFKDDLWSPEQSPDTYDQFRIPGKDDDSKRDIEEIPEIEVAYAARYVLKQQFGLPREELAREVARLFGVQRVSGRITERIGVSIDRLISDGKAVVAEGCVRIQPVG